MFLLREKAVLSKQGGFFSNSSKRAGSNKSKQAGKIEILAVKAGRNFHDIFKNDQALVRASRLEKSEFFSL